MLLYRPSYYQQGMIGTQILSNRGCGEISAWINGARADVVSVNLRDLRIGMRMRMN